MRGLFRRSISSLALVTLSGCASVEIPDIHPYVTLPASGDGYTMSTVSHIAKRVPKRDWDVMRKRGIVLLSEDWAKLKYTLLKNCLANECKQSVGTLDSLFYAIDNAFKVLP